MPDGIQQLEAMKRAYEALEPLDEDGRTRALGWLAGTLGVTSPPPLPGHDEQADGRDSDPARPSGGSGVGGMDAKAFLSAKNPRSDVERVTCLAYFLTHGRRIRHFKSRDLTELNVDAAGARFSNISQSAKDAVKADYLASVGKEGKKQITGLGEAVIEALPDREKVKQVIAERGRRRRKRVAANRKTTRS